MQRLLVCYQRRGIFVYNETIFDRGSLMKCFDLHSGKPHFKVTEEPAVR